MSLTLTRRHNVDRFGYLIPTKYGNVPMVGAVATYRPSEGRFGGAVAVEEGTTNLLTNPHFENDLSDWSYNTNETGGSATIVTDVVKFGSKAVRIVAQGTGHNYLVHSYTPISANTTYTASAYVRAQDLRSRGVRITIWLYDSGGAFITHFDSATTPTGSFDWLRLTVTFTTPSNAARLAVVLNCGDGGRAGTSWWDGVQLEQKPFATSFVDGTRAAGQLQYPQLLNKKRGTLSVWINPHYLANWNNFFNMDNLSTGRFLLYFNANGVARWDFGPPVSGPYKDNAVAAGRWDMHTLTWDADAGVYRYYVNGEFVGERQYVEPDSLPSTLPTVGNYGALLDELLILPYAASEEEIRAWYEADGPIPPHPAALLQWGWQAVRPATMVAL